MQATIENLGQVDIALSTRLDSSFISRNSSLMDTDFEHRFPDKNNRDDLLYLQSKGRLTSFMEHHDMFMAEMDITDTIFF